VSFVISHRDLYSKHIPLFANGTTYNQQAHILIADRVIVSNVLFNPTYSNVAFKSIVTATKVLIVLGTKTVTTLINSKGIVVINNFKIIVLKTNIVFSLLFCIN
jgi:hypothetical protein